MRHLVHIISPTVGRKYRLYGLQRREQKRARWAKHHDAAGFGVVTYGIAGQHGHLSVTHEPCYGGVAPFQRKDSSVCEVDHFVNRSHFYLKRTI